MVNDIIALFPVFIVCNKVTTEGAKWWAVATIRTIMCVLVMTSSHHDTWPRGAQRVLELFLVCRCTADNSNKENKAQYDSSYHLAKKRKYSYLIYWKFFTAREICRDCMLLWKLELSPISNISRWKLFDNLLDMTWVIDQVWDQDGCVFGQFNMRNYIIRIFTVHVGH